MNDSRNSKRYAYIHQMKADINTHIVVGLKGEHIAGRLSIFCKNIENARTTYAVA